MARYDPTQPNPNAITHYKQTLTECPRCGRRRIVYTMLEPRQAFSNMTVCDGCKVAFSISQCMVSESFGD